MTSRSGLTLTERSALSRREQPRVRARHCWVLDPQDAPGRWPGVCLECRRIDGGWEGLVAYAVTRGGRHALVEEWLPAAQLEEA